MIVYTPNDYEVQNKQRELGEGCGWLQAYRSCQSQYMAREAAKAEQRRRFDAAMRHFARQERDGSLG